MSEPGGDIDIRTGPVTARGAAAVEEAEHRASPAERLAPILGAQAVGQGCMLVHVHDQPIAGSGPHGSTTPPTAM